MSTDLLITIGTILVGIAVSYGTLRTQVKNIDSKLDTLKTNHFKHLQDRQEALQDQIGEVKVDVSWIKAKLNGKSK